jgi:hypothetical protein
MMMIMIMVMMMMMIYRNVNRTATMWFSSNRVAFNRNFPHNRDSIAYTMQKALPALPDTLCQPTHTIFVLVACGMRVIWQEYLALWGINYSNFGAGRNIWKFGDMVGAEGTQQNANRNSGCPNPDRNQVTPHTSLPWLSKQFIFKI